MNMRNLATALLVLALSGTTSVLPVCADAREVQAEVGPAMTFERSGALEMAAADLTLPPWQREIMRSIAQRTPGHGADSQSSITDSFSPQRIVTSSDDGAWLGLFPTGRTRHTAIYDPVRDRMVVFGGWEGRGSAPYLGDVWELTLSGSPEWRMLTPSGSPPSGRFGHSAIYDPVRDRMVVFGGAEGGVFRNDVWAMTLSGSPAWSALAPLGSPPPGRLGHSAIYDPGRDQMLVFGGTDDLTYRNDVWALTLSGTPAWIALTPVGSPPSGREGHSAIYDPVRDRMMVFGGSDESTHRNGSWALTLSGVPVWSALAPIGTPPPGLSRHSAIYDPVRDRMVVFGGRGGGVPNYPLDGVWVLTFSGTPAWNELAPTGGPPRGRAGHTAFYDPVRDRMVMFAGDGNDFCGNDVWAMSLSASPAWSALPPSAGSPSGLSSPAIIYDPVRDRMLVFGGYGAGIYRNDVWALTLSGNPAWSALTPSGSPPVGRLSHNAIYDPLRDRMVVFGGASNGSYHNDVWALTLSGTPAWSPLTPSGTPPTGRSGHAAIYDPVRDRMVVFGGAVGSSSYRNDVWALTLSGSPAWSALTPAGSIPPELFNHTAIYDPARDRMIVFGGGESTTSYRNDVWALTLSGGSAWSKLATLGSPPTGRIGHAATYDPVRDRMVVFAGYDGPASYRNDVWALTLSGSPAWCALIPTGTAPSRRVTRAIYDPERDQMVVFGGSGASADQNDVWALGWNHQVNDVTALNPPFRTFLHPARPNPGHSRVDVRYEIASDDQVRLEVLDIQGRVTRRLRHGIHAAGSHSVVFDRRDDRGRYLPAGMYLVRLQTRNETRTSRIVLLP